jgi:hypothetical protein
MIAESGPTGGIAVIEASIPPPAARRPAHRSLMARGAVSLALLGLLLLPSLVGRAQAQPPTRPRLVLVIVVDQLRQEYLNRMEGELDGGIGRLLERGAVFTDAYLAHYPSVTAVGHATVMTGAMPAQSGIVGNDWFDRASGKNVASVSDDQVELVGAQGPGASPRRLLVSTVGDELKTAEPRAKVIGISSKDRAAILPAGRMADLALWFDRRSGRFVTSTWYTDALPGWAEELDAQDPVSRYAGKEWSPLDGHGEAFTTIPTGPPEAVSGAVNGSPFGSELLVELALSAIRAERLGQRGVTDILAISFSANDSIGHHYGPESPQIRDATLRTDRDVLRLLEVVETQVGLQHTIVVLTSDHGVAPVPEEQVARRMPGGRITGAEILDPLKAALNAAFGEADWVLGTAGSSVYLNHARIRERGLDGARVRQVAAAAVAAVPQVARVFTRDQLLLGQVPPDPFSLRVLRSYHSQRSGDLEILLDPYWMRAKRGTTHGTPYTYDTHIPLLVMGPGIRPGCYHRHVDLNDLAPTLATLVGTEVPSGSSGRILDEMLDVGGD